MSHRQLLDAAGALEFSGQLAQGVLPYVLLYVPAAQGEHSTLFAPLWPALHTQGVTPSAW